MGRAIPEDDCYTTVPLRTPASLVPYDVSHTQSYAPPPSYGRPSRVGTWLTASGVQAVSDSGVIWHTREELDFLDSLSQ